MKQFRLRFLAHFLLAGLFFVAGQPLLAATFTVTTTVDELNTPSGANVSLREALRDANAASGTDTIVFSTALNGATIVLTNNLFNDGADTAGVTIDASALA